MLITTEVEVKLKGSKSIGHYKDMGYEIPYVIGKKGKPVLDYSKTIMVKVIDLPEYSEIKVIVKCDYQKDGCKDVYPKNAGDYLKNNINSVVHTDCCSNRKCQAAKTKECNMINLGVEHPMELQSVKDKLNNITMNKYGTKYMFGSEYFKNKSNDTIKQKYNVDNISQLDAVKVKKAETFFSHGSIITSRQQKYIHKLLGGQLNYACGTPNLDIAFPDKKVYIEVNGSGHDLCVKSGNMRQDDFDKRETRRYYFLKRLGWKMIAINSPCDYLPNDEIIIEEFNKALKWFESNDVGHWHYNINIGKSSNDAIYGKLRRIKEKDLIEGVG